jgi:hypothetical protein
MTKARDIADFKFENIVDTGTEGTKIASGTTAQRGSTTGQWRYNSTTGFFEGRDANSFVTLSPSPTVTSVSPTNVESAAGGNETFTIVGTNFATAGATVKFIGSDATEVTASSVTVNSTTSITAVIAKSSFANAKEPYDVKVTNTSSSKAAQLDDQINVDNAPAFSTAAGSLGTVDELATGTHFTLAASDPEGDTVTFAETGGSNVSGSGLTLNSNGTISGDPTDVSSDTTVSFTARATANGKTADRNFSYVVGNNVISGIDYSGIKMWFDANATSTQTLSGSTVTQWNSKKNSNYQFRQATSGANPTRDTSLISGKTVIDIPLNATGMWGYDNDGHTFTDFTWAIVMSVPSTAQFTQFMGEGNNQAGKYVGIGESGQGNGNQVDFIYGFGQDARFELPNNNPVNIASTTSNLRMFIFRSSGTRDNMSCRVNGTSATRSNQGSNVSSAFKFSHGTSEPTVDLAGWWGRRYGEGNLSGSLKMAEWILWENELNTTQTQQVEAALVAKWGSFS